MNLYIINIFEQLCRLGEHHFSTLTLINTAWTNLIIVLKAVPVSLAKCPYSNSIESGKLNPFQAVKYKNNDLMFRTTTF